VFFGGKCLKFASLALCGASLLCRAAAAAPETLPLTPATTKLALTVYGLGFFPLPGQYARFTGTLDIDRAQPEFCRVRVTVDQTSLSMADPGLARQALGADLLDATHFPTMSYVGTCTGHTIAGALTLHGVTHALALVLKRDGGTVDGAGRLVRHEYGIDGMPHLLGQVIKIRFVTRLPIP
jgi:polyisoprenoid-binding protein YceI